MNQSQLKKRLHHGAAMLIFVVFFTFTTSSLMFALGRGIFSDIADLNRLADSKRSYIAAESLTEDMVMRTAFGTYGLDSSELLMLNGVTVSATSTYDSPTDTYTIESTANANQAVRKAAAELSITSGTAFNYGVQAGNGGILITGHSDIIGNLYSNGTVDGSSKGDIFGDIVSAGPTGLVKDITATGSVYANTIDGVTVGEDAYYNVNLGGSSISGTTYSPVANQPTTSLPISTTTVQEWKDAINDHGTVIAATDPACSGGTYIMDASITIGYVRIECDVIMDKNTTTITLDGPVWIEGNLNFKSGPEIHVDAALGRRSVPIIVDNTANRLTSSIITVENSTNFYGSGDDRSFVLLMSMNESAELGGSGVAINLTQSADGDVIMYAGSGLIDIANSIDLVEVTAHQIKMANGSSITYQSGLASLIFTSGPGGDYKLTDWRQEE